MKSKSVIRTIAIFCLAALGATAVMAQDIAPRAIPGDIVTNPGFESGTTSWKVTNAAGDKVKCKDIGHISNCAFMFKSGAGEKTKIQQVYTPGSSESGTQNIGLISHIRPFKAGMSIQFFVKVKFKNGAAPLVKKYNYTSGQPTGNYESIDMATDLFNPGNVKKVVFGAQNKSTSGKAYIDEFYVGAFD